MADIPGIEELKASTTAIREAAKWLITAFAAIGALLLAGSQLSRLGALDFYRFWASVCGVVLGLTGVVWVLKIAINIITPGHLTLTDLVNDGELSKFINDNKELLKEKAKDVDALRSAYLDSITERNDKLSDWTGFFKRPDTKYFDDRDPFDPEEFKLREQYRIADGRAKDLDAVVTQVLALAAYERLRQTFRKSRIWLAVAAMPTVAGIILFAWAANRPEAPAQPHHTIDVELAPLPASPEGTPSSFRLLGVIGPFLRGKADCLETPASPKLSCGSITNVIQGIGRQYRALPGKLTSLIIIGSADVFELQSGFHDRFGTYHSLARARANWVVRQLVASKLIASDQSVLSLTVGPGVTSKALSPVNTAKDRTVAVWGFVSN